MKTPMRQKFSTSFGVLGYLALILQWMWALILLLPPILRIDSVQTFVMPKSTPALHHAPSPITFSPFLTFAMVAIAFVIVLLGIFFAIKSPAYAVKHTDQGAKKAAQTIAYRTAKRPENAREVRTLSARILWMLKAGAVLIGLILSVVSTRIATGLTADIILTIAGYLTIWPVLWFGLQYLSEPRTAAK